MVFFCKKYMRFALICFITLFILIGCNESNENININEEKIVSDSSTIKENNGKIFLLPTPIQLISFIKYCNLNYNPSLFAKTSKISILSDEKKLAYLGFRIVDMSYAAYYNRQSEAELILLEIKSIAEITGVILPPYESILKLFNEGNYDEHVLGSEILKMSNKIQSSLFESEKYDEALNIALGVSIQGLFILTSGMSYTDIVQSNNEEFGTMEVFNRQRMCIEGIFKLKSSLSISTLTNPMIRQLFLTYSSIPKEKDKVFTQSEYKRLKNNVIDLRNQIIR